MATTQISWYKSPIEKEVLKELTKRDNFHGLTHIILQLAISVATSFGVWYSYQNWPWWATVIAVYIHSTFFVFWGLAGAGHELSHKTVFKSKPLNEFFMVITGFFSWTNFVHFRQSHRKHHQLTVHTDEDLEVILPIEIKWWHWLQYFTVNFTGFFRIITTALRHSLGIIRGEWEQRIFPPEDKKARRRLFWWGRVLFFGHVGLAAWFIYSGNWILVFVFNTPMFVANWLNAFCGLTQHTGLPSDVDDFRVVARTVILGPVLKFFYWNMNYHVEHHMFAGVPYYKLPQLREAIKDDLPVAMRGLIPTWIHLFRVLREQRKNPEYVDMAVLPDAG
jgi:fatty acid desaturase